MTQEMILVGGRPGRKRYVTLDGMRGVAAAAIFIRHNHKFFGFQFQESFLAVDFFFVLSGFVVAQAYGDRLKNGLRGLDFTFLRLARFFPLYLVGTLLGIAAVLYGAHCGERGPSLGKSLVSIPFSLLLLPTIIPGGLFPFNGPAWSLFYEAVVNSAYGFVHRRLGPGALLTVLGVSALGLVYVVADKLSLDCGFRSDPVSFVAAFSRLFYSFAFGLLLFRWPRTSLPKVPAPVLFAALLVLLCSNTTNRYWPLFDLFFALLLSPLLVALGSVSEPSGGFQTRLCVNLGIVSYPMYIIHQPLGNLLFLLMRHAFHVEAAATAPWTGIALFCLVFAGALWLDAHYDRPARTAILARLPKPAA